MRSLRLAVLLAVALATLAAVAGPAWAREPVDASAAAPARKIRTSEDLEKAMLEHPVVAVTAFVSKFLPAIGGIVVLILGLSRAKAVRRGLLPPPPPRPPPTQPYGPLTSFGLALVGMVGGGFVLGFYAGASQTPVDQIGLLYSVIAQAAGAVPVALIVVLARRRARLAPGTAARELPEIFDDPEGAAAEPRPPPPPPLPWGTRLAAGGNLFLVFSLAALAIAFPGQWILESLGKDSALQEMVQEVIEPSKPENPWLILVYGVLVAPFAEECIFRGLLHPAVRSLGGPRAATIVVSLLFAAVHITGGSSLASQVPTLVSLWVLALMLSWVFERTNSIAAVTVAHALNNATSLAPVLVLHGSI